MAKIIGNTTATPNPRPDWEQLDETKADYIKNKPTKLSEFENDSDFATQTEAENYANAKDEAIADAKQIGVDARSYAESVAGSLIIVESIAKGANQALSFENYESMVVELNDLSNDAYNVGQNIMIVTLEVPDLWISSIAENTITYTYTSDEDFTNTLKTTGMVQVGYFKLSALETQKVDLTDYTTKEYVNDNKTTVKINGETQSEWDATNVVAYKNPTTSSEYVITKTSKNATSGRLLSTAYAGSYTDSVPIRWQNGTLLANCVDGITNNADVDGRILVNKRYLADKLKTKTAVKVNGEIQEEWDATDVVDKTYFTENVPSKTNNQGYPFVVTIGANNLGFQKTALTQNAGAWSIPQYDGSSYLRAQTSDSTTDSTMLTNKTWVNARLKELQDTLLGGDVEAALNTLKELAAALGNDPNFATTMIAKHTEMEARLNRVDKFTADDVNKFVVVGVDGELTAVEIADGEEVSYG